MRLLVDTQVLLRSIYDPAKLTSATRTRLSAAGNEVCFSAVSLSEIAIKTSLAKPGFSYQPQAVADAACAMGFEELPLQARHAQRLAVLPWHHRDPFDRILVAQAMEEGVRFLTTDRLLTRYSEWVEQV